MRKLIFLSGTCACLFGLTPTTRAQTDLPPVDLATLPAPANWKRATGFAASPDSPALTIRPGNQVLLVGTSGEPLALAAPTGDFALRFEALMTPGADAVLTLPNGYRISLGQSRAVLPLLKAPGLWQVVTVAYRAATDRHVPMIEKMTVNGAVVGEGQSLARGVANPVQLMAQNGSVALRNVGFRALANQQVANWAGPLTYKLYAGDVDSRDKLTGKTPVKTDTVRQISYDVSYGQPNRFALLFDGKLNVPTADNYQFDLLMGGMAGLWIDGQPLVPMTYHDLGDAETKTLPLTAGLHDVQVMFVRSWPRPGVGLFVSRAGTRPQALHVAGSLPEFSPAPQVSVQPEVRPTLIRSFVQLPGEPNKRTNALSVGNSSGLHYTVDLAQMALLTVWKGDFADVTQMWYERGEPQLLQPLGTVVRPSPRPALALLANANAPWPDSLDEKTLIYNGFVLNKTGTPTLEYTLAGLSVKESLVPTGNRLEHIFSLSGNVPAQPLYCRLAAGKIIEEIAKGLFAIDNRSYYVRVDPKAKLTLRQQGNQQELMMPVTLQNGTGTASYTLEF